jgi:hypothetical protein
MDDSKFVWGIGVDIATEQHPFRDGIYEEVCNKIEKILEQNGFEVIGIETLDTCWTTEEYWSGV